MNQDLMNSRHALFLIFVFTFLLTGIKAQVYYDDASLRLNLKFDKRLSKNLDLQFTLQNRFRDNMTHYSQFNANPELVFKASKHFKILAGYVYGMKRKPEGIYLSQHQMYGGVLARVKFSNFTLMYRNIVQAQTKATYDQEKASILRYYDRNKFTVKYEINKYLEVYTAYEANVPLADLDYLYIRRSRYYLGGAYKLTKRSYLEGYFLFQTKIPTSFYPTRDFIYGLTYSYDFK
jgi:hypothetical protein